MNVPREPILKSEKLRRFFFFHASRGLIEATHLCTTFGMAAWNWNRTPIRHWFVSVVIVSNAGRERNWIHRERNSIHMKLLKLKPWILHSQILLTVSYWAHSGRVSISYVATAALFSKQVPNDSHSLSQHYWLSQMDQLFHNCFFCYFSTGARILGSSSVSALLSSVLSSLPSPSHL